jgi:hypothetical protein
MATMIVETGAVVANANSYVSLADADAYFEIDVNFDATWDALTDTVKEQYLMWATRILDQKVQWKGDKTDEDSALRWPRTGVYDRDGNAIDTDAMPVQLTEAVCELIKYLQTTDVTTSQGADFLKSVEVDVIKIEYQNGAGQSTVPPLFNQILRGLGYYPTPLSSSFARIVKV